MPGFVEAIAAARTGRRVCDVRGTVPGETIAERVEQERRVLAQWSGVPVFVAQTERIAIGAPLHVAEREYGSSGWIAGGSVDQRQWFDFDHIPVGGLGPDRSDGGVGQAVHFGQIGVVGILKHLLGERVGASNGQHADRTIGVMCSAQEPRHGLRHGSIAAGDQQRVGQHVQFLDVASCMALRVGVHHFDGHTSAVQDWRTIVIKLCVKQRWFKCIFLKLS